MLKLAVAALEASIVTMQFPLPLLQAPDQPAKPEPLLAVGIRATLAPVSNSAAQVPLLQAIPAGLLVTAPEPEPASVTESW